MPILAKALATTAVTVLGTLALAQDAPPGLTTSDKVRSEISEAVAAVGNYSEQQRDEALARAREAIERLDAEIERREYVLLESWSEMSETARGAATATTKDIRNARNAIGERFGALQAGSASAWEGLKTGFSEAWDDLSETWNEADDDGASG